MPMSLTPNQADFVSIFAELHQQMGCAPSVREMAAEMDTNIGGVEFYYAQLEERGWIERQPGRSRGVRLLHAPPPVPDEEAGIGITEAGMRAIASDGFNPLGCGPEPIGPRETTR